MKLMIARVGIKLITLAAVQAIELKESGDEIKRISTGLRLPKGNA